MTLPVTGSRCGCRHCAQISFIMHCIGELIEPIARCEGLRNGASTPCRALRNRRHHLVGADRDDAVALGEGDRLRAELAAAHTRASPARCCRRTPGPARARAQSPALRRCTRRRRRRPPRCPRPCSGRSSSCSRRSRARSSPRRETPGRWRTARRCRDRRRRAPPFRPARSRSARPVGPIRTTGSPGSSCAQRSDDPPISSTMVETSPRSRSTHAPVSARPSIASRVPAPHARQRFVVLQAIELARARIAAAAAGARTTTSTIVGRQALDALDRRAQLVVEHREELGIGRGDGRRHLARAPATRSGSPASRSPSPSPRCRRTTDAGRRRSSSRGRRAGCR